MIAGWAADFRGWVDGLAGMGNSLSPRKRELLLSFSPATAGMSVVEFCRLQGVSTTTFYRLRERAAVEGVDAALVPRSRAPLNPARVYDGLLDDVIIAIHQQLEDEGKDAGPWSVWWRMEWDNYKTVPSRSTIARRMRALGLSKPSPRKRPKSSWKRFVRGCRNELWQLDGISSEGKFDLSSGEFTIYQIVDDCTRYMVGLRACPGGETTEFAQHVLAEAFRGHGRPSALLTDNGAAFNTHRRNRVSDTEKWLAAQGIRPISGRVDHPQTQGKVERSHQGVMTWLKVRTFATLDELNGHLDDYVEYYNNERQHLGLGPGTTPAIASVVAPLAGPLPGPIPIDQLYGQPVNLPAPADPVTAYTTIAPDGRLGWRSRTINFGGHWGNIDIVIVSTRTLVTIYHADTGDLIVRIPWPQPQRTKHTVIGLRKPPFSIPLIPPYPKI